MKGYKDLYKEFGKYGWCDIATSQSIYGVGPIFLEVRIMLNPDLPHETSDANVRNAMYGLAEAAIKYARETYHLVEAPQLNISGEIHRRDYYGCTEKEPIIVTSGRLELRIVEKEEARDD